MCNALCGNLAPLSTWRFMQRFLARCVSWMPTLGVAALLCAGAQAANAQSQALGPLRSAPFAHFEAFPDTTDPAIPGTYWKEGAAIGAAALAIPTLLLALGLCGDTDSGGIDNEAACVAGGTAVMALVGGALGAFIGGAVHKDSVVVAEPTD